MSILINLLGTGLIISFIEISSFIITQFRVFFPTNHIIFPPFDILFIISLLFQRLFFTKIFIIYQLLIFLLICHYSVFVLINVFFFFIIRLLVLINFFLHFIFIRYIFFFCDFLLFLTFIQTFLEFV